MIRAIPVPEHTSRASQSADPEKERKYLNRNFMSDMFYILVIGKIIKVGAKN
jgi:hypothetical protein